MAVLALPAAAFGQTRVGDVGIDMDDVRLGDPECSPYLNRAYTAPICYTHGK